MATHTYDVIANLKMLQQCTSPSALRQQYSSSELSINGLGQEWMNLSIMSLLVPSVQSIPEKQVKQNTTSCIIFTIYFYIYKYLFLYFVS